MIPIRIKINVYDNNANLLTNFNTCRYFKITKNSLLTKKFPFYNQYQFFIEVPVEQLEYIKENNIFEISVFNSDGLILNTFIVPNNIQIFEETEISVVYNILGISVNSKRFITEETLCRVSDYDQFFRIFSIPRQPFSTSIFDFLQEGIFKVMDLFYGPYIKETTISDKFINKNALTIQNLPIQNNFDTIFYYFEHFYPILDLPFFAIDDCYPLLTDVEKQGNYTAKLILNSYQNILENKEYLTLKPGNNYRILSVSNFPEIENEFIYQFAYGDYIIHNIDHPMVQNGPSFTMPRIFGKKLKVDEVKSVYTVYFNYPINEISLKTLRSNFEKLVKKSMLTTAFTFINVPIEFFQINKIISIENENYYIYGGEFEFLPISKKSVGSTEFKANCVLKTIKI